MVGSCPQGHTALHCTFIVFCCCQRVIRYQMVMNLSWSVGGRLLRHECCDANNAFLGAGRQHEHDIQEHNPRQLLPSQRQAQRL